MKLRSGKVVKWPTANFDIDVPVSIKLELNTLIDRLKDILKDDKDFASLLVEKSLLIGKGVYTDSIKRLLFEKYPKLFENKNTEQLFDVVSSLGQLIYGSHELTRKKIIEHPEEDRDQCREILRTKIEQEVIDTFFCFKNLESIDLEVNLLGE